jgi:hypothetical protein
MLLAELPKEKPGFWTRRRAFVQVRRGSNIQLLSFSLVAPSGLRIVPEVPAPGDVA